MDPLHLFVALAPLAVYMLLLGLINNGRRPLVTSGARDVGALGIGISGFVIVGPMELFFPEAAGFRYPGLVWVLLLTFYAMSLTLVVLLLRPRLVIYNIRPGQIRPLLAEVVNELDKDSRWAGETLVLPNLGVQLYVESSFALRNVQLAAAGPVQSFEGWRRLEYALASSLRGVRADRNPYGISLIAIGLLILGGAGSLLFRDPETLRASLEQMLRL